MFAIPTTHTGAPPLVTVCEPQGYEALAKATDWDLWKRVFFVGGGTCAGKTTLARSLSRACGAQLFSADDHLGRYARLAELAGSAVAGHATETDFERFWMRDPVVQFREMLQFYRDIFPFVAADLADAARSAGPALRGPAVVAEGIAFLPELLAAARVPAGGCLFLTAGARVHAERYARRDWIHLMLEGCSDRARAFELWMARDELFAAHVRAACARVGYRHVLVG